MRENVTVLQFKGHSCGIHTVLGYWSTHQSNPRANEGSIIGAMSLAPIKIVLSAVDLRSRSISRNRSFFIASISSR